MHHNEQESAAHDENYDKIIKRAALKYCSDKSINFHVIKCFFLNEYSKIVEILELIRRVILKIGFEYFFRGEISFIDFFNLTSVITI